MNAEAETLCPTMLHHAAIPMWLLPIPATQSARNCIRALMGCVLTEIHMHAALGWSRPITSFRFALVTGGASHGAKEHNLEQ